MNGVAGCFTPPLSKAGQLVQQWVASSSLLAGAGWWAARVIGRENSVKVNWAGRKSVQSRLYSLT